MGLPSPKTVVEGFALVDGLLANAPKLLADASAIAAQEKNPTAEIAAVSQLITDLQSAFLGLAAIVGAPAPTTAAVATQTTAAA